MAGGFIGRAEELARLDALLSRVTHPHRDLPGVAVLLRGRRFVVENEEPELPIGLVKLAAENGLWVGEKR